MTTKAGQRLIAEFDVGQFGRIQRAVDAIETEAVSRERERIVTEVGKASLRQPSGPLRSQDPGPLLRQGSEGRMEGKRPDRQVKPMSKWGRKPPTTDPNCPKRDWHHNGQRCDKCGGVG